VQHRASPFRLERLRALRERAEDRAREDLAATLALRLRGEAMLEAAQARLRDAQSAQREHASAQAVPGFDVVALQRWRERVERSRRDAELELVRRDEAVEGSRAALREASRDREALERLKLRHKAGQDLAARRAESAVLDEVALGVHRRHAGDRAA
jgi:flagellar protein FliJ